MHKVAQKNSVAWLRAVLFIPALLFIAADKPSAPPIGKELDRYKDVAVYFNGNDISASHGKHCGRDGYYYGQKWQCVEFAKRFLYDAKGHSMPDGYGDAKDFFDDRILDGGWNEERGMFQYRNGGRTRPQPDDVIVFDGTWGHVAIITEVHDDRIEIIQQNREQKTRETHPLSTKNGRYQVGDKVKPFGWLRVKPGSEKDAPVVR